MSVSGTDHVRRWLALGVVLLALLSLAVPPGAAAADASTVEVTPSTVTVTGDGAAVVIDRAPFRMTFLDADGLARLTQLAGSLDPLPVSAQPSVLGITDRVPNVSRYGAFSFEVGGGLNTEFPGSPWGGNLLLGGSAGLQHVTTDVLDVAQEGDAVVLTLGTDAPGREVVVTIAPDGPGRIGVSALVTPDTGVEAFAASFEAPEGERYHGFGGRHNALDQRGRSFLNWTQQENFGSEDLEPVADATADVAPGNRDGGYMLPNGDAAAYYVQSQFISSRGYGFLLDRSELSRWDMAAGRDDAWRVAVAAPRTDFVVAPGGPAQAIDAITELTGRHQLPPEWAVGPTQYRGVRVLSAQADTPESYAAAVRDDLAEIDRTGIPFEAYAIEGWDFIERDVLRELVEEVKRRDMRVLFYIRAFVGRDVANTEEPELFEEAIQRGVVATTPGGAPYLFGSPFIVGVGALLDFTNPETVVYWEERIREMLDLGADGFMQDFGEQTMSQMRFHDGSIGEEMHNRYSIGYHRLTREILDQYEAEHPDRELFMFVRTGYSGRPGSAAFEGSTFPGDETSDFSRTTGLGSLITDMLNRAIGGAYGFNTDIGGYADYASGSPTRELFVRWSQAAALMPFMRNHNSSSTGHRTPWSYDEEVVDIFRHHAELHLAARPLIMQLWREALATGMPVTRPLWLQYPDDDVAAAQDQQFLLGPDVLVAPVVTDGARSREVYFPDATTGRDVAPGQENCWFHPETGERFVGGRTTLVDSPLDRLPYFFRCGTDPFVAAAAVDDVVDGDATDRADGAPAVDPVAPLPATGAGGAPLALALLALALLVGRRSDA